MEEKHVMTINLDYRTGELIEVLENGKKVVGHEFNGTTVLKNVPINKDNVSTLVYSHGSPGCYCYIRGGRIICVPAG